jgi:UDP-GlcNAc:undecaprenyl-phosphate GlcNAc-1-phosphate transferase
MPIILTIPPNVVYFTGALVATAAVTPVARKLALRAGLVDRPSPHKFHQQTTPYLGGVAVAASVLAAMIAAIVIEPQLRVEIVAIALGGAAVAVIGLADDWFPISPLQRLAIQGLAGIPIWAAGIRLTPSGVSAVDFVATVLVVLVVTNSINILDNMDGLSTGTVAIACLFFFFAASWQGQHVVSVMAIVVAGACLGFLPFNFNPARIFLGDTGTLFLGFIVATIVIKLDLNGYPLVTRAVVPMMIMAVPLFDLTLVVVSRLRAGRPVFRGATDHSSHRLVALGVSARQAALLTYAAGGITGAIALALLQARNEQLTWLVLTASVALGLVLLLALERVALTPRPTAYEGNGEAESPQPARSILDETLLHSGGLPAGADSE